MGPFVGFWELACVHGETLQTGTTWIPKTMEDRNAEWLAMVSAVSPIGHRVHGTWIYKVAGLATLSVAIKAFLERRWKGREDTLSQECDTLQENDARPDKMCCKWHGGG